MNCFFATDLHGLVSRYEKLRRAIAAEQPKLVFLGGDLLPSGHLWRSTGESCSQESFIPHYLAPALQGLREQLGNAYPQIFLILGNDDFRSEESAVLEGERSGLWTYLHARKASAGGYDLYGYACVPPTPFLLKDWERYDISRYVPPGAISPEEGSRTTPAAEHEIKWATIKKELAELVGDGSLEKAVLLVHTPPSDTPLDHAALDGRMVDHVPVDPHIGSIAVRQLIEERQPLLTLHGHVHEAARLTGTWKMQLGRTVCINGAHDGPELALVRFNLEAPADGTRELI